MYIITSLFLSILFAVIPVISMEHSNKFDTLSALVELPVEASIIIVAYCESKNALHQTCKHFCKFASRIKNENILVQSQLQLNQEALDRYLLYYGALGKSAIVRNLLAKGANPNACEDNGITLLHYAMQCGYSDIANMLLERSDLIMTDLINSKKFSFLPAMQCGKSDIVARIFSVGTIDDGEALCYAVHNGLYTTVQTLLARNVSANAMNKRGEYPLYLATKAGHINIMKLLMVNGAYVNGINDNIPLLNAAGAGCTSAVQLLIDYGANCNVKSSYNSTALHFASEYGYFQIVKILLEKGAYVNEKNNEGNTPLHRACILQNSQIMKIILKNGSHINEANNMGCTPLDYTSNEDNRKLLIVNGGKKHSKLEETCAIQ